MEQNQAPSNVERVIPLLDWKNRCQLWERGVVLDLGSLALESMRGFALRPEPAANLILRTGESYRVIDQLDTELSFWLDDELPRPTFQAQVFADRSDRIAAYIDGRRLGAARLRVGETSVISIQSSALTVAPGLHTLRIGLSKGRGTPPGAGISWVRIGKGGWDKRDQPATRRQVFSEVTIADERQTSIVLQAGAKVRCPVWIPEAAALRGKIGLWGGGEGEGEVAIVTADGQRSVIHSDRRDKEDEHEFESFSAPLATWAHQLVELEFSAHPRSAETRIAVASPELIIEEPAARRAGPAKRALVIILSGLEEKHAPPEAGENGLPFFNQLAQSATFYPRYRSTSTNVTSVVASLLSGSSPLAHGITEPRRLFSSRSPSIANAVEAAGGRSSFFTGVPYSFQDFGFDRGFERFSSTYPQQDESAQKPLLDAQSWLQGALDHDGPVLAFIHLRGAHPPFDISKNETRGLEPPEYGGNLSPRRAAIILGQVRDRRSARSRRLPQEDWKRLHALQKAALLKQSQQLTALISFLKAAEAFDDSLIIVMGDVGAGEPPRIPYEKDAPLLEEFLSPPLLIKYPGAFGRGQVETGRFAPRDLTRTIATALGIEGFGGSDRIDMGTTLASLQANERPHLAFFDEHYSLRTAGFLLSGSNGRTPHLCLPEIDPQCVVDRAPAQFFETRSLYLEAWDSLQEAAQVSKDESQLLELSTELENALIVWGDAR